MAAGYPIVLDVRERLIVIVGGGGVATRKAKGLIESGGTRVRVISPTFSPQMPSQVQRVNETYRGPQQLEGASLVFAATDQPDVNDAVVRDAHQIGALACRADVDETGEGADFATPAMLRDGPLLITVSSGGSPALSGMIRDRISAAIDPRWVQLAEAMQTLRPMIRQKVPASQRREIFRTLCSDEAIAQLSSGGVNQLRSWLSEKYPHIT
jgi:precorrin-2 dehydrogenase/sirohydrochlorin ferrochelatase